MGGDMGGARARWPSQYLKRASAGSLLTCFFGSEILLVTAFALKKRRTVQMYAGQVSRQQD